MHTVFRKTHLVARTGRREGEQLLAEKTGGHTKSRFTGTYQRGSEPGSWWEAKPLVPQDPQDKNVL